MTYIITIHGGGLTPWKPFFLYRWCFDKAFRLVGISERICEEYRRRTGREVRYIPPLFPFTRSEGDPASIREDFGIPRGARVILYVGSLKELKSPGTLLRAFNRLDEDFVNSEDLYLVFAGDGPLRPELEGAAKYRERTVFLGNVPREDVPDLYRIASLYVITSRFEGTPLSLLEAVFNRIPVAGSDVGGINAVIEDGRNGILFEYGDHEALSNAIRRLILEEDIRNRYTEEAFRDYRARFSFETVLAGYRDMFAEAADER